MRIASALFAILITAFTLCSPVGAQVVARMPLPVPQPAKLVTLDVRGSDKLLCGTAEWYDMNHFPAIEFVVPFLIESDAVGNTTVLVVPDTGIGEPYLSGRFVSMQTAVLRDGPERVMVAWSRQERFMRGPGRARWAEPVLFMGVFENKRFRLLTTFQGGSDPTLLRDASGTVHLVWTRQTLFNQAQDGYLDAVGELRHAGYFETQMVVPEQVIGTGLHPSATLEASGGVHVLSMEYDSIPHSAVRVKHVSGRGANWGTQTTMAEFPAPPWAEWTDSMALYPDLLAFAADGNGVARVVLWHRRNPVQSVLLACSSDGRMMLIDSTAGREVNAAAATIDAGGNVYCAFSCFAGHTVRGFNTRSDSLFLCRTDAALTSKQMEVLSVDSTAFQSLHLLQAGCNGVCLFYTLRTTTVLTGPLEQRSRQVQIFADSLGTMRPDVSAAVDSSGSIWMVFGKRSDMSSPVSTWLLRTAPCIVNNTPTIPRVASDLHIFPNPATSDATLRFVLPSPQSVTIFVHDLLGREVLRAADGAWYGQGTHLLPVKLGGLAPGMYEVRAIGASIASQVSLLIR